MSSEIAPSADKTEKPVEPLAESDNRNDDNTSTDEVDAAPSRRPVKVAPAHWHTQPLGERPAPLAQEEDETDIMDPMQRELAQLSLQSKRHQQKHVITNINNNIPTNPKTTYSVSKYVYNMHHAERGIAIIINNVNFHKSTGMSKRGGSMKDAEALEEVLGKLGFKVKSYTDLTVKKTRAVLKSLSRIDYTDHDCFLFAIMSHGEQGVLYGTDDTMPEEDITTPFRGDMCPTLAGKPKLFFMQACRGQKLDSGVEIVGTEETDSGSVYGIPGEDRVLIPSEADFLVGYSSPPGYYSWRNQGVGAWFIQAIISVLKDHGTKLEIQQMMTRVNHIVAYDYMSNCSIPGFDKKKQIPCIVSTLTKELYFTTKD